MVHCGRNPKESHRSASTTISNSSLLTRKCLLAVSNRKASSSRPVGSSSSVEPSPLAAGDRRTRPWPNLFQCHGCGCAGTLHGGRGGRKLLPIESRWRVVLLCRSCTEAVDSREVCGYCFLKLSDPSPILSCFRCHRLVHRGCGLRQRNSAPSLDPAAFVCVDCWVPNSAAVRVRASSDDLGNLRSRLGFRDVNNLKRSGDRDVSDSCSVKGSRGSPLGNSSRPLEDIAREVIFERKRSLEIARFENKAKKMASNHVNAADPAKTALNLAAIAMRNGNSSRRNGSASPGNDSSIGDVKEGANGGISDKELVLRLHRAMNGSPRIWKKNNRVTQRGSPPKQDGFLMYRRRGLNGIPDLEKRRNLKGALADSLIGSRNDLSDSSKSDTGSHSVCGKFKACTEDKLFENPDRLDTEPSVGPDIYLIHGGANCDCVDDQNINQGIREISDEIHASGQDVLERLVGNGGNGIEGDHFICRGSEFVFQVKEEEASCSNNKPANSSGDGNSLDSEFESGQVQQAVLALGDGESTYCQGESSRHCNNLSRIGDQPCSSQAQKGRAHISDEWPKKYRRRCLGVKGDSNRKAMALSEGFTTESHASADAVRVWKPNCCKNSAALSNGSCQSPPMPHQASVCASGVSGCQT